MGFVLFCFCFKFLVCKYVKSAIRLQVDKAAKDLEAMEEIWNILKEDCRLIKRLLSHL